MCEDTMQSQYALLALLAVTAPMPVQGGEAVDPHCWGMVPLAQSTGDASVDERLAIGKAKVDYMRSCAGLDAHIEDFFGMCVVSYDKGTRMATAKCNPESFRSSSKLPDEYSAKDFTCEGVEQMGIVTTNDPDLDRLYATNFAKDEYINKCEKGSKRDAESFNNNNFRTRYDPKTRTAVAVCLPNTHCGTPRGK